MSEHALIGRYVWRFWSQILIVACLTVCSNLLALIGPALLAAGLAAFNRRFGGDASVGEATLDLNGLGATVLKLWPFRGVDDAWALLMVTAAAYVLQATAVAGMNYVVALRVVKIRSEVTHLVQMDLMRHLLSLSLRFFHRSKSGELVARFVQDARNVGGAIGPAVQGVLQSGVQLAGFGLYLFATSPWLSVGALIILGAHFTVSHSLKHPVRLGTWKASDALANLSSSLHETILAIRVVKSFGAESIELSKTHTATDTMKRVTISHSRLEHLSEPVRQVLDALALVAVFIMAASQFRAGQLTGAGLILYVYVARMIIAPANLLAVAYLRLQAIGGSVTRIAELFALQSEVPNGDVVKRSLERSIELRRVSFAYGELLALKNVSLDIPKGKVIALVGPSGAGKSTLTDLVLRLYDPLKGEVLIDGLDLRSLELREYRRLFGVVSQESLLFHDTIRNNIRYGRDELTDDQIRRAARIANAESFILKLPHTYDTVVGDRGVRLSGGERQRIAIARAVVHEPEVLILDEAMSALDSDSERQVQQAIEKATKNKTALVIAHRLSTVLHADGIVVIDDGGVVDVGRHSDLLQRCSLYRTLCALQFVDRPAAITEIAAPSASAAM